VIQLGEYQLDCARFELLRDGKFLKVERKPIELLVLLTSREGQIVTRAEIAQRLWSSEVFVDTEHGINTAIAKLRHVLRDQADRPRFIQTVTGVGYRFIAPITAVSPAQDPVPAALPVPHADTEPRPPAAAAPRRSYLRWYVVGGACMVVLALAGVMLHRPSQPAPSVTYTQLTDFTDSAVAPAVSPDGHMLAFIRGGTGFLSPDQIYVKLLPNGEATRLTNDPRPKYGLAFSPDGSQIAYTVLEASGFSTYVVSSLGGESRLLLNNAAGLVWLDSQRLLFSEIKTGIHLGVVNASPTRTDLHEIYLPAHQRAMAHNSVPSPDHAWALVVEMNGSGGWGQCRLVSLQGKAEPRSVGPAGACTSAGWSPDGRSMYFTAFIGDQSHVWQQRFPDGNPEQVSSGPTEESGLAVQPDGTLITSVGVHESSIWIHDPAGDRQLSSEGEVMSQPVFSSDGTTLFYLLRKQNSGVELWRTAVGSGQAEAVFPGISIVDFDISPDGKQVVYTATAKSGSTELWTAPLDRSQPTIKVGVPGALQPRFGMHGQILFQRAEGDANYLEQVSADGAHRSRVLSYPILHFRGISPGRRWAVVEVTEKSDKELPSDTAVPLDGGPARRLCQGYCDVDWSTTGKFLFVTVQIRSRTDPGRTLVIPIGPGESLSDLPPRGIAALGTEHRRRLQIHPTRRHRPRRRPTALRLGQHHHPQKPLQHLAPLKM